jgi:cytochrome bd-type quinol oxidase subunit 1
VPTIFDHVPHPHIQHRKATGPPKAVDQLPGSTPIDRFNTYLALKITGAVGTMWCAYVFAALALISLPEAVRHGLATTITWLAQTFLQLVLLSIIIVGQNVQSAAADERAEATYQDADAVLHTAIEIQAHMAAQDIEIDKILSVLARLEPGGQA